MSDWKDRQRFNRLRRVMGWSWKDIDRITGRKNARTNISRRVPAWSFLAIEAQERYEGVIECFLVDAVAMRLGKYWQLSPLSHHAYSFIEVPPGKKEDLAAITMDLRERTVTFTGNSTRLYELVESLRPFYDEPVPIEPYEEGYRAHIILSWNSTAMIDALATRSRRQW